jgi:hypothetical protein
MPARSTQSVQQKKMGRCPSYIPAPPVVYSCAAVLLMYLHRLSVDFNNCRIIVHYVVRCNAEPASITLNSGRTNHYSADPKKALCQCNTTPANDAADRQDHPDYRRSHLGRHLDCRRNHPDHRAPDRLDHPDHPDLDRARGYRCDAAAPSREG